MVMGYAMFSICMPSDVSPAYCLLAQRSAQHLHTASAIIQSRVNLSAAAK